MTKYIKNKVLLGILAVVVMVQVSCNRTKEEFLGPQNKPASSGFTITGFTLTTSGIGNGLFDRSIGLYVLAQYNQNVSWKITYTGVSSGAIKTIYGTSSKLDSTNNMWRGESGNDFLFSNESVLMELKVVGYDSVYTDNTIFLSKTDLYNNKVRNNIRTIIVDAMEGDAATDTSKFDNPYSDLEPQEKAVFGAITRYAEHKIQGSYSYFMKGQDFNYNSYVGGTNTYTLQSLAGKINQTNPNDVFVNFYVYGFGTPNTALNVILYEMDTLTKRDNTALRWGVNYNGPNNNFTFDTNVNDLWQLLVPVDWKGWKLVSLRYNQFRKHNTKGKAGNNIMEPHKLSGMAIELSSSPELVTTEVKTAIDFVTITEGGPFSLAKK